MRKQFRRLSCSRFGTCLWSKENYTLPALPKWVHSRHLRRRTKYLDNDGTAIIEISNSWYIHSHRNGIRILCALPF
jgi:hypothetical protein